MQDDLMKLKGDKKIPLNILFKRTFVYIKPEWLSFVLALLLLFLNVFLDLYLPIVLQGIIENLQSEKLNLNYIFINSTIYLLISITSMVLIYFESMILQKAGQRIVLKLRMDVFTHITNMSLNQFTEMPVGSLVTRVANYTQSMSDLFTNLLVNVLKNILYIVGVYAFMLYLNIKLSLFALIPVVIIAITSFLFSKVVGNIFRKERKTISDMNTYLNENLSGMKITQIFNQEEFKDEEFKVKNEAIRKARFQVILCFGLYRPFVTLIYILSVAACLYLGFKFGLSGGAVVAFYLYLSKFFNPIQNLADQLNGLQKAFTASERLFNLMDVEPEVRDSEDAIEIENFKGKIEFRHVWFAYNGIDWILKDVSFTVNPKETCAFVGATGAGKTTILSLIVRNYEIQQGQILIDDVDISKIKIKSLRRAIGQMMQDVFLFSGSIKDNITLHDTSYTDEDVIESAKYVNAYPFIEKLPNKLEEQVIERGENFSQGQRQLLSFARTVLAKPQVLILDEATANIDTETEVLIQESLEKMKNIGTMLVVAHRLSTIQHADKIVVLSKGEIKEMGNHQELLAKKGLYYNLYELQYKSMEEE
ncbi:MAG: ABC transporter ATP-binding protein [Acholeplasmatales bacterium]|nr:ABC transporter ATP-binding protein [Acholeplasmatales bacterium]